MFRPVVDYLEPYDPGLFIEDIEERYGIPSNKIINLASNENPYPPPEGVIDAIRNASIGINRYPRPTYERLKDKLSEYTGLPAKCISVGNGASEIFDNICKICLNPYDRVVMALPTYSLYILLSMLRDASLEFIETEPKFEVEPDEILSIDDARLIFLCTPNNPTGKTIAKSDLMRIVEETDALVVVDESYQEFSGETIMNEIDHENLIVVRSFSKYFGLAGLRIGYALSSEYIIELLEKTRLPFNISSIAQAAAMKAIDEREWYGRIRDEIIQERAYVTRAIDDIPNFEAIESEANFILVNVSDEINIEEFEDALCQRGIIVRDLVGVPGLKKRYVRITIGKREENQAIIDALKDLTADDSYNR